MFILQYFLSLIFFACAAREVPLLKNVGTSEDIPKDDTNYRLPGDATPYNYRIKLWPHIAVDDFTFKGESWIDLNVPKPVTKITLHAKNLTIQENWTDLSITSPTSAVLPAINHKIDTKTDFLTINFDKAFYGNCTLNLRYAGKLHDDLYGFYRSSYVNARGEKVWLATTQFEPTWARRAFPCFDEPALKATFDISINHHDNFTAISNMRFKTIERDTESMDKQWTRFEVTPVMSTYLIAFVVSDFEYLAADNGRFRIWSKPSAIQNGRYALLTGAKELEVLNAYTGIEQYGIIEKMDNVAIPDFRAGAMENWGIVTYREKALLYEEKVTSTEDKQGIATVISHEFAHQWFGNLVSPLWWDYTWLNEGFANYFQYYITDKVEDTWRLMDQFVVRNLQGTAFISDDKEDQHPMNGKVNSPLEISGFFDSITYSKAGSVIRMISHAITEQVFQTGIRAYLEKMKYKAANSDDLFVELAKAGATPKSTSKFLNAAFDSWANQRGYPVVHVIRNYTAGTASITQHRFLTEKLNATKENWYVPINYAKQSDIDFKDTRPTVWLTNEANKSITISGLKTDDWIVVNKQQTGYYRVNYDEENWSRIVKHLNSEKCSDIHVLNRAQILDDAFHLSQAGELSDFSVFLKITTYLKQETDYVPWTAAFRSFTVLNKLLANTADHGLFKAYTRGLLQKLEKNVGFTENGMDDHVTKLIRPHAIKWTCYAGSPSCAEAHKRFLDHIVGSTKISTDLRGAIFCAGIRLADGDTWVEAFQFYKNSTIASERSDMLSALGCSPIPDVLRILLELSITPGTKIFLDDATKAVITGSEVGIDTAFDFINANLPQIIAINNGTTSILTLLNEMGSRMTTSFQLNKLNKFIAAHEDMAEALSAKALVSAKNNIEWHRKNHATIELFLQAQNLTVSKKESNSAGTMMSALPVMLLALAASVWSRIH